MEEQTTNKYDPAVAEQKFQSKLSQIKNLLARYTTEADKGNFYERNKDAIEELARGNSVSNVMTGFRTLANQDKTYDARIELQYYKNSEGKWAFSPRFHFKREKLLISPIITLPTAVREEYTFSLNECKQNKLEASLNIGGELIKVELNEAELTELSTTKQLSRSIKSRNESKYEYRITAQLDANKREIDKLVIIQVEKTHLTDADIEQLKQKGRLDKPIKVGEGVNERKYFVAVDKELNKLAFAPTSAFNNLNMIRIVNLSPFEINNLLAGQKLTTTMMYGENAGAKAIVYLDPVKRNLKLEAINTPEQQKKPEQKVVQKVTMSPALQAAAQKPAETQTNVASVARQQRKRA
jgi:ribosomal protein S17E